MNNFEDMASRAYKNNHYIFSDFLSLSEQEDFYKEVPSFPPIPYELWGGFEDAERKVLRFGNEDYFGYLESYPLVCLKISPINAKFASEVTHRDYLGALMNLGIERRCLGDIIVDKKCAYVFCVEKISAYIIDSLVSIGRNTVKAEMVDFSNEVNTATDGKPLTIQVASMRCDAIVAKAFNLSRKDAAALFFEKRIAVNGRLVENNDYTVSHPSAISVRGFGKIKIVSIGGLTRKGNQILEIELFK